MTRYFKSVWFTDTIWTLLIECSAPADELSPFNGEIDSKEFPRSGLDNIEHLIIGICLYEPQTCSNYTTWINETLKYCTESNMFPNLKSVYVLYDNPNINVSKLIHYYPIQGGRTRYFLLRSDGTEEKAVGLEPKNWIDESCQNGKAVFMLGDITNRQHKFPLLYKFYSNNKLDYLEYSLTYVLNQQNHQVGQQFKIENYDILIEVLNDIYRLNLNLESIQSLYNEFARELPGDKFSEMAHQRRQSFDLANYVFPPAWNDAGLIINPETWWRHPVAEEYRYPEDAMIFSVTEKTWKPIATKRPFIGISVNDVFDKTLESLGFRTFRKYTNHPDLIDIPIGFCDPEAIDKYLNITYERIISFIDNMHTNKHDIWEDIQYNHQRWQTVLEREWDLLYQHCPPLKHVPKEKILRLFVVPYPTTIGHDTQNPLTFGY